MNDQTVLPAPIDPDEIPLSQRDIDDTAHAAALMVLALHTTLEEQIALDDSGRGLALARSILPVLEDAGVALARAEALCRAAVSAHLARTGAQETVLGDSAYTFRAKPGPYQYREEAKLRAALDAAVGTAITRDELDRLVPEIVEPERVIPARTYVTVADPTALSRLCAKRPDLAAIVDGYRDRSPGVPRLERKEAK